MRTAQAIISQLTRFHPRDKTVFVRGLAVDLSDEVRNRVGDFVGVIRAECPVKAGEALAAHIEDAVMRGLTEAIRRLPAEADQERLFEAAVSKVNDALYRLLGEDGLPVNPDRVSSILMTQAGQAVVAAAWGQPSLLLFHPRADGRVEALDLLEDEAAAVTSRGFGFSHLVSGSVGRRDRLLIATDELRNAVGQEAVASAVMSLAPNEAVAAIRDAMNANRSAISTAMAVSALEESLAEPAAVDHHQLSATQNSIEQLLGTQTQTNAILSPSPLASLKGGLRHAWLQMMTGWRQAKDKAADWRERRQPAESATGETGEPRTEPVEETLLVVEVAEQPSLTDMAAPAEEAPEPPLPPKKRRRKSPDEPPDETTEKAEPIAMEITATQTDTTEFPIKSEVVSAAPIPLVITTNRTSVLKLTAHLMPVDWPSPPESLMSADEEMISPNEMTEVASGGGSPENEAATLTGSRRFGSRIRAVSDRVLNAAVTKFNALPQSSRWLLIAILIIILALNVSLGLAGWRRWQAERVAAYDRSLALIEQKLYSADSSLIYNDAGRAGDLVIEAQKLAEALPGRNAAERTTRDDLLAKVAARRDTLRQAVKLPEPAVVATVATAGGAANLTRLADAGKGFVWVVSRQGDVFRVSLGDGRADKLASASGTTETAVFVPLSGNILFGGNDGAFQLATPSGKTYGRPAQLSDGPMRVPDAATYAGRLYLLDPDHRRILRLVATETGFGSAQPYLKDDTDVSRAVSLAIDGDVWVLSTDGRVAKLASGSRREFSLAAVEPALGQPRRLRTSAGDANLYVYDGNPARVVSFEKKTGALVAQYESDQLSGAGDFLVDEKAGLLYVVNGNRLLKFEVGKK
ncbi:MAG: hypothetical protein PHT12_00075 [Patescibacteria group bacterium]|nr:hypothetical protein [Patescibacteria group bacterium]